VFLLPEVPTNRYQLVHDYLVSFIRQQQDQNLQALMIELERERSQRQEAEKQLRQAQLILESANQKVEAAKKEAKRRILFGSTVLCVALAVAAGASIFANSQAQKFAEVMQDKEVLVAALKNWGWTEPQINILLSTDDIRTKLPEVLRANTSLQKSLPQPFNNSSMQGQSAAADADLEWRSQVTVKYYAKAEEPPTVKSAIEKLGFQQVQIKPSIVKNVPNNLILYGESVNPEDVKLVAYTLIRAGIEIKAIRPFHSLKLKKENVSTIQVEAQAELQFSPPLKVEEIRNSSLPLLP
jgi:hypothetical protein